MRVFLKPVLTAAAAVLLSLCFSVTSRSQSMPGYQPPDKGKPATELSNNQKAAQGKAPLAKLYGHLKPNAAKIKLLPALTPKEKKRKADKQFQIGVTRSLPIELNPLTDSALYSVAEGDVRVAEVVSTGALYMRLHFKSMSLPAGARVFVYSATNPDQFAGPYEGRGPWGDGTFWTPPIPGDAVFVEYLTPAGTDSSYVPFTVSEVSHIYKSIFASNDQAGSCNLEITQPWTQVAKSVGLLDFVSGGAEFTCTGTLLNDAAQDQKPFVLTANHCISTQSEAQSVIVYWNYLTGDFPFGTQTTTGANLIVTGSASDFSLLLLTGSVPTANVFFSGWDASPVSASTSITGIHHPSASHKRISFGATNANCISGLPGPCQNFTGVTWSQGVTEPGSSGSGIWTGNGDPASSKLVGQLYGGFSNCANPTGSDYYGRFSVTYPNVGGFLNGSCVASLTPTNQSFSASGGSGSLTVNAPDGCSWSASSTDAFVTVTSGNNGSGAGTVNFTVAANSNGVPRVAFIVVGSQLFTINQLRNSAGSCAPAGTITLDQTINANLQPSCPAGNGSYVDAYTFTANAGQRVVVSMTASFDTILALLNTDGTLLTFNDDSGGSTNSRIPPGTGMLTLPNTGTYTILATSFDPGVTGSYALSLRPPRTLTVASTPDSNVLVAVTPNDLNGNRDGSTQFTRSYAPNTTVTLNAPGIYNGKEFKSWQKDGVTVETSNVVIASTDADHTFTAVYGPITTYNFTFKSSNPDSGVAIDVNPNDNSGAGNGVTTFTRNYNRGANVFFSAPQNAPNGNLFQKWQRDDGYFETSRFISTGAFANSTWTAVYVAPLTFTMTVSAQNPSSGINITVTPNDNNGSSDGAAPFTRTYYQGTNVTLTAPASAPNGNVFDRWVDSIGGNASFSHIFSFFMDTNKTFTAVYATKPFVWLESGTGNAIALNSVTFLRGPFQILDPHNFSFDGHTRIVLFTSAAGITQADQNDPTAWVVTAQTLTFPTSGWTLPVEAVGPYAGGGLIGSYIVVKLPDGLPTQQLELRVRLRQITSDASFITIAP